MIHELLSDRFLFILVPSPPGKVFPDLPRQGCFLKLVRMTLTTLPCWSGLVTTPKEVQ